MSAPSALSTRSAVGQAERPAARARRLLASGWVPAGLTALAALAIVTANGVDPVQALVFGAYVVIGIALPGLLWLRLLRGRAAHIAEDLALGLALGYCVEV